MYEYRGKGKHKLDWVVVVVWGMPGRDMFKVHGKFTEATARRYAKSLTDTAKYFPEDIKPPSPRAIMKQAIARPVDRPEGGVL